ncbi:MAG: chromosome segregation protein ScpA [Clostridiales bacterium]|nr:chromosome segregation protein ScpA [Clostridiales bacterium]
MEEQKEEIQENIEVVETEELSDKLSFNLENFSGPLDLLYTLVKKNKLEIEDIEISSLTEQYLEVMKDISTVDMEVASEFIEYAALLIEIKSKKLLPKINESEDDEFDEEYMLKLRLKEYEMFKQVNEKLKDLESNDKFYKAPEKEANKYRVVIKDMNIDMLLDAFVGIMHKVNKIEKSKESKEIVKETFTVEQKIATIKDMLISRDKFKFSEMFLDSASRDEVITTFMALLELIKMQAIRVSQDELFSDIQIEKTGEIFNGELI